MSFFSNAEGSQQRQLGDVMIELGMITSEQLDVALEAQRRSGDPLGQILVEQGFVSGAAVAHALAIQAGRSLRTEYGFALGIPVSSVAAQDAAAEPRHRGATKDDGAMALPKLRLVDSAFSPGGRNQEKVEIPPDREDAEPDRVEEGASDAEPASAQSAPLDASLIWEDALLAENEQLRTALFEARSTRDLELRAISEERDGLEASVLAMQGALAEAREQRGLAAEIAAERDRAIAEVGRLQDMLDEAPAASADELARVSEERDRLASSLVEVEAALGSALSEVAAADAAAAACEVATEKAEHLKAALEEAQSQLAQQARLAVETQFALRQTEEALRGTQDRLAALEEIDEQRTQAVTEVERLKAALTALQTEAAAASEEHGQVAVELYELQQARVELEERLAVSEGRVEESARDLDGVRAERDRLAACLGQVEDELAEVRGLLGVAEAAVADRDAVVAEAEGFELRLAELAREHAAAVAAADAEHARLATALDTARRGESEALERLAAAESDAHDRAMAADAECSRLVRELGDAELALREMQERLAAADSLIEARDRAETEAERLRAAVDAWQAWAAGAPAASAERAHHQVFTGSTTARNRADAQDCGDEDLPTRVSETSEYMLLVPTGHGYELVRGDGPSPAAGETVEVPSSDDGEIRRFVVARVGRSALPDRAVCVYLIPE